MERRLAVLLNSSLSNPRAWESITRIHLMMHKTLFCVRFIEGTAAEKNVIMRASSHLTPSLKPLKHFHWRSICWAGVDDETIKKHNLLYRKKCNECRSEEHSIHLMIFAQLIPRPCDWKIYVWWSWNDKNCIFASTKKTRNEILPLIIWSKGWR